jgi:tRNA (mo5U34)-methyltransferase
MTLQSDGSAIRGEDAVSQEIQSLAPWFHNLHLPDGRQTAPDHPLGDFPLFKWEQISSSVPSDMTGMSALDIGCNAGFYSVALIQRGAQVLGIDVDPHYLRQAAWARERFGIDPEQMRLRQMQIYELAHLEEQFDVVLFLGVLYHLRYPLLALDIVAQRTRDLLVLQTLTMPGDDICEPPDDLALGEREAMLAPGWPKMAFIEKRLEDDPTNWWAPNRAGVEAMLRSTRLEPAAMPPGHEITVAHRSSSPPELDEMRSVLGRSSRARQVP